MARNIPRDRPLSDEDRAWLEDWSQHDVIAAIDASFPPGSEPADDDDTVDVDEDISKYVESLKVDELRDDLEKFNIEFDKSDKKDELVATLAIGLQEKRNAGEEIKLTEAE